MERHHGGWRQTRLVEVESGRVGAQAIIIAAPGRVAAIVITGPPLQ